MYVLAPLIGLCLVYGIAAILIFKVLPLLSDVEIGNIGSLLILIITLIITIKYGSGIIGKLIDYAMDFCIITPYEIIYYNQNGILERKTEVIDTERVKTLTKDSSGFFHSLLNYGNITFLSEGDQDVGEIVLDRVEDPENMYQKIRTIIEPHMNIELKEKITKSKAKNDDS